VSLSFQLHALPSALWSNLLYYSVNDRALGFAQTSTFSWTTMQHQTNS